MKKILLIGVIFLAAILRLWQIGQNPAGFFTDEASNGINAYKIATTGLDNHGKPYPVLFEANGDWRDPVYIYSLVPSVYFFGLSEFSVRVVSALYGIGAVILIYFLGKEIADENTGLLFALLLAISPWHVHLSRVGFQLIAAVFWIIFTFLFLYKSLKNPYFYIIAAIGIILSFFSYSTTKLYIFPLLFLFFICNLKTSKNLFKSSYFWAVTILSVIVVMSLIYPYLSDGNFFARWHQVDINMNWIKSVISYFNHFSYSFLFSKGDAGFFGQDVRRHSIMGLGELHYFQLPFLLFGISRLILVKNIWKKYRFFLFFLLLYPLGTIFTQREPQATRSVLGVIPFTVITGIGIIESISLLKTEAIRRIFKILLGIVIAVSVYVLVINIKEQPVRSADYWGWQYGYRPILKYFTERKKLYDGLIITHRFNAGEELMSFYRVEYDCDNCSIMHNPIEIDTTKRQLFALRNDDILDAHKNYPQLQFQLQKQILLPNGTSELFIGEFRAK